ncbi:MAG TPA: LCP family protein [Nocardioidaceae bacterium]|nr:LCP family protein [Nocardioidaceae bacterium]
MSASPSALGGVSAASAAQAAQRVQLRRALTLLGMTLVAPGSAQLVAGNKTVGRIALRVYAGLLVALLVLVMIAVFWRGELITLGTSLWWLRVIRFGLIAVAVGWGYLIVDAWRIADPLALGRGHRLAMTLVNGALCLSLTGGLLFASHLVAVQRDFIATVFGGGEVSAAEHGRYNVLLLGGDAGPTRVGLRPDSITVASIDQSTGRTVLIGLPRNLENVPFPAGTPMHKQFPHGFNCDGCYINGVNTWATDHADLFPGSKTPGIDATTEAVEQITGLKINYYALIDLRGFQDLVDAVGGVTIDVRRKIPIGGVGAPITGWIQPGRQKLDGFETLWYSRSRATSNDYSRMARQKCVMNAMLHQLDAKTVLLNFSKIAKAGKQIISTSIPASEVDTFINLSLKARSLPVSTVSFVPPTIDTGDPDYAKMLSMVSDAITASEARDDGTAPSGSHKKHHDANHSNDLAKAC